MSAPFIRLPGTASTSTATMNYAAGAQTQFKLQPNEFPPFPSHAHDSPLNRPLMDPGDMCLDSSAWGAKMHNRLTARAAESHAMHRAPTQAVLFDQLVDGDSCASDDDGTHTPPAVHVIAPSPTPSDEDAERLNDQFDGMDFVDGTVDATAGDWHIRDPLMQSLSPVPLMQSLSPVGSLGSSSPAIMHATPATPFQFHQPPPLVTPGEAYWHACAEHWHACAEHWHNMCLDMQRHVSLVCVPLAAPNVAPPFPYPH
jgi:hypothetical protein